MGLLSGLFGGGDSPMGGGNMPPPPQQQPSMPPPMPPQGMPMGNRPPMNLPAPFGGQQPMSAPPPMPQGQPQEGQPIQMPPGANPNSIPGGPATSWRPQSLGAMVGQANQMLQKGGYDQIKSDPQFQKIMQNLDGSILKNVPDASKPVILDHMQNLRSQLGGQLIPVPDEVKAKQAQQGGQSQIPGIPQAAGGGPDYMKFAHSFVGMNEQDNADTLSKFFKQSLGQNVDPRNTAWCAAFVNGVLKKNGLTGSGSLMARSFLGYGQSVPNDSVQKGDIAVFGRGKAPYGHVGFVDSYNPDKGTVTVLSGNQHDSVTLKEYPVDSALGFRRIQLQK